MVRFPWQALGLDYEAMPGDSGSVAMIGDNEMKALLVTVIVTAALALAALFSDGGTAQADTLDATFLSTLAMDGISSHTPSEEIALAHSICNARRSGLSQLAVITVVYRNTVLSAYDAGFFVGAAESAYCPAYSGDSV